MATTYTPATNVPPVANYVLPDDGEEISFASFMQAVVEPLANGIGYLANNVAAGVLAATNAWTGPNSFDNITVTAGNHYKVSSRTETRTAPLRWIKLSGAFTEGPLATVDDATGGVIVAQLDLPHGQILTGVSLFIDPAAHGALPAVMPSFIVKALTLSTGAASATLISQADTSGNAGAYEVYHAIAATGAAITIDTETSTYYITYTNESGANSQINTSIQSQCTYTITRTTIGED